MSWSKCRAELGGVLEAGAICMLMKFTFCLWTVTLMGCSSNVLVGSGGSLPAFSQVEYVKGICIVMHSPYVFRFHVRSVLTSKVHTQDISLNCVD